jgi:pentatricopeptide repeat protein
MDLNFVKYSASVTDMEKAEAIFTLGKAFLKSKKIEQAKALVVELEIIYPKAAKELLQMLSHCDSSQKVHGERKMVSSHFKSGPENNVDDPDVPMHGILDENQIPAQRQVNETPKKSLHKTPSKPFSAKRTPKQSPVLNNPFKKAESHNKLATEAFKNHNYVQAISLFSAAIDLDPTAKYYSNRAASRMHLSLFSEALQDCFLSIEKDPLFEKSYARAIQCYFKMGKFEKALEMIQVAKERIPSFETCDIENQILIAKKDFSELLVLISSSDFRKASLKVEELKLAHPHLFDIKIFEVEIALGEGRLRNAADLIE